MENPVEALDDQKDWHGQRTLFSSSRLGLDAAVGWMRGLALDTREVRSHVRVLLGCVKFYFKKKLKLIFPKGAYFTPLAGTESKG